jgi:hypothetical protein
VPESVQIGSPFVRNVGLCARRIGSVLSVPSDFARGVYADRISRTAGCQCDEPLAARWSWMGRSTIESHCGVVDNQLSEPARGCAHTNIRMAVVGTR